MRTLRLFHFDIKTLGNYGDTILFELVRELFEGFGDRKAFKVVGSNNLRWVVGPKTVDNINRHCDAVVIGGGGLFLRDTNQNRKSGWQWSISSEQLARIEKPLIVFGVGNNRFIGQEDFRPNFRRHVNAVMKKSVFFGLRNKGSINTIREYIDEVDRRRVVLQPCPTTLASYLLPDYVRNPWSRRRVGLQALIGRRQIAAGFDRPQIYESLVRSAKELKRQGYALEVVAHAWGDLKFHQILKEQGVAAKLVQLYDDRDIFRGMRYYGNLPLMVGMRGHAQMIPFGLGNGIVSLMAHHKLRYFCDDIGHPELCLDVREPDLERDLVARVEQVCALLDEYRDDFEERRKQFLDVTLDNLGGIYRTLSGSEAPRTLVPLNPYERFIATLRYNRILDKEEAEAKHGR